MTFSPSSFLGPSAWSHDDCKGKGQSPIDITHDDAEYDTSLGALTFKNYDSTHVNTSFRLHNNGHTVQVDVMQNGMSNGTRYQTRFKGKDRISFDISEDSKVGIVPFNLSNLMSPCIMKNCKSKCVK